jgi:hypothetical protein
MMSRVKHVSAEITKHEKALDDLSAAQSQNLGIIRKQIALQDQRSQIILSATENTFVVDEQIKDLLRHLVQSCCPFETSHLPGC